MLRRNRISFMEERLRRLEEQNAYLWQEKAFGIEARGAMKATISHVACVVVAPRSPAICGIFVVTKPCARPCVRPMMIEAAI